MTTGSLILLLVLTATLIVMLLDEVDAAVVIIIVQNDKQLPKLAAVDLADVHKNLDQVLIRKSGREGGDGLDEVQGEGPWVGGLRRGIDGERGPRHVTPHLVTGTRV